MLLGDIPERNARFYPEKAAVIDGEVKISHARFYDRVKRLANFILSKGVEKGDRVAVLSHNCYQYLELYFACAGIGTPVVPLNFRYNPRELLYVIKDSGARVIFYASEYASSVDVLKQNPTEIRHFICINDSDREAKDYEEIISRASALAPAVHIDEDDLAVLGYTGGTTGKPKGVMTTHRNIITSCYNTALERGMSTNDIFLNVPPVFHAGGANSMFAWGQPTSSGIRPIWI
jgi:acyl-CoA synthetase (AMP-forming)/AMP-acid ligase II